MSDTTTTSEVTPIVVVPSAPSTAQQMANDSLMSPQFILAVMLLVIAAGTIAAVFIKGNPEVQNVIAGTVIGTILGAITGFYYGSSKGSQNKDAATILPATSVTPPPIPGTVVTTTTPPATVTTTTGQTP